MSAAPTPRARAARLSDSRTFLRGVSAETYARLRALIASGGLGPGAPLIETDLSLRLQVSRTPIRAALLRLQQEGFVHGTRVGQLTRAIVAPLTATDVRELHYVVGALEGIAARKAAGLPTAARSRVVHKMEKIHRGLKAAAEAPAPELSRAQDLHVRFHRCYVEAAAGPRLLTQLDVLQPQIERYERFYTDTMVARGGFTEALREHEAIIQAIRQGRPEAAERAVMNNWRNGARRYGPIVERAGDRGNWPGEPRGDRQ